MELLVAGIVGILMGAALTMYIGDHYINHYVEKMTPAKLEAIDNMQKRTDDVTEESLWATDLDPKQYGEMMGWTEPEKEDNANY